MQRDPRLGAVRPPHGVKNFDKRDSLLQAFRRREPVTPVVVLTFRGHRPQAISGSHRLAAMKTTFGPTTTISSLPEYVITHDGDRLLRNLRASGDQKTLAEVRSMLNRGETYFPDLVDRLAPYLRGQCGACALADQGATGKAKRKGKWRGSTTTCSRRKASRQKNPRKARIAALRRYWQKRRGRSFRRRGPVRKVVFLDMGGTLNHGTGFAKKHHRVDTAAVKRLEKVCRTAGADVVISSSWRRWMPLRKIERMLRRHGLTARVVGKTPSLHGGRAFEVASWLREHPGVTSYAVLDDHDAGFNDHFVAVDSAKGLQTKDANRAVRVLRRG